MRESCILFLSPLSMPAFPFALISASSRFSTLPTGISISSRKLFTYSLSVDPSSNPNTVIMTKASPGLSTSISFQFKSAKASSETVQFPG